MASVLTVILAGGRGMRLQPLTARRAKPVVPVGNRALIDHTLTNCEQSRLGEIVVLTQHHEDSVREHLQGEWSDRLPGLTILSSRDVGRSYLGTADAVRAALARHAEGRLVLVLAGDHLYDMDYRALATDLRALRADATLGCVPVPRSHASRFGCVELDGEGIVHHFLEKPSAPPPMPNMPGHVLASMGIYLFRRNVLESFLYRNPDAHDFGHDVLPRMIAGGVRVAGHSFTNEGEPRYWRDISDVDAYHAANMDLLSKTVEPGDSWIGPRSLVAGGSVDRCVLGRNVQIGPGAHLSRSVLLNDVIVERGARLRRVVVEVGMRIPADARIGFGSMADHDWGTVTPGGITVVTRTPDPARRATAYCQP